MQYAAIAGEDVSESGGGEVPNADGSIGTGAS